MPELFSRMFRAASPTKASSDGRSHPSQLSHARNLSVRPDSRSQRRSEDARPSITLTAPSSPSARTQVVGKEAAAEPDSKDWHPPISPPGRLRSTSHPSLSSSRFGTTSAASARRKAAPAPLDLSLSRHEGIGQSQSHGLAQPGAGVSAVRAAQDQAEITARPRPATSHGMHARSQSHHLPALSAFGMDHPPRPSSVMDTATLPPSLRGQYLLDTHRSIELDRPVYTPIDRPSFDVAGTWSEGPYERSASAAAKAGLGVGMGTREADVPVSAAQVSATAAALAPGPGADMDSHTDAERTPRRKTSTSDFTPSLSRSAKSPKSLSKSLSKKPSILRTLAHHPSLSALRKKKKDKEQARLQEEERYVETPDLVGDVDGSSVEWTSRENTTTPTPGLQEGQAKSLWGSVKRKTKRGKEKEEKEKEKGLRGVKSVPGLRMSSESTESNWRSSTDLRTPVPTEPVPAIPAQYAKSAVPLANAALGALIAGSAFDLHRQTSAAASSSISHSRDVNTDEEQNLTPQKQLRLRRGRSEDLSPAGKGKLGAQYTLPNRHLGTPPVSRIKPISPPRHSMPPGTGTSASPGDGPFWDVCTRDPLPLHLHSRRMSVGSETDAEYNEDDYGDLPSRREGGDEVGMEDGSPLRKGKPKAPRAIPPSPTSAATAGSAYTEEGMTPLPTPTLPQPPRSKTTTPYGARRKGSSMPMSQSEMGGGSKTPIARKVNELQASNETTGSVGTATPATTAASRAESPFEVKFSPMVAKRMSLDAFGTSSLVGVDGQVVQDSSTVDAVADEDGVEELEEEYEDIALDEDSGAEEDLVRARSRSRSRSLSQTPHRRPVAQEYEDPDADYDMDLDDDVDAEGSEASFDGTTTQAQSGAHPYANHGYSQSFALAAAANTNTLDGWVGTQLTTIKEFPSTATLDYIPDTSIWEGDGVLNSRRQSLVRSAGTVQGLSEEGKESATVQKLVRSPRLSDGLAEAASESRQQAGPEDISKGNASLSLKRSPAMPFGLADRSASASTATDDFDRSDAGIAVEGNSMYRTPLISRAADGGGEIGKTPWTTKSGMTAFFTPLSYPVPGHQAADRSMAGEDGTDSPCAGRENSKVLGPAQAGSAAGIEAITPQDGEEPHNSGSKSTSSRSASSSSYQSARSLSSSFSSASRRLRIRSSSLPPIADEGIDITVQHNEQLSALEVQLAAVVKDRRDKEEQYETLRRRMSDVERQRRAAEEGRQEAERKVGVKERQVSESASSVQQMRQALSDNEFAYDRLQAAHDDLADRLATAQQAIEMAQAEKIDVQSEIQVLANGTAVMANQIRELEEEIRDARAQSRSVAAERLWNSGEVNGLRSDLRNAKREAEQHVTAMKRAESKLAEKETLVSLCESEVVSLKGELQEMKVKVIGLQRGMVEKDRTVEMCRDKVASKQFEVDEVKVKLVQVQEERDGLEREVQELREELIGLKVQGVTSWEEEREEMQAELETLRSDLANKDQLEQDAQVLEGQLNMSEAQVANLRHQLVAARADLEAKSGDLSLTSGEVDQLHAELEASAEQVERLESAKARMERDHKRALGEAKWDVNEAREQLRAANEKLQEALIEREVSQASTRDSASRLAAYLDEIERLERELGTLRGGMEDKANEEKGRDEVMERMREEMRALTEDKELLNIALESKTMEVALLQRQLPKQAQGAAKGGQTTPKRKLVASTSRLSMNGRGDVTPKASERLAKSALGTPSGSSRASLATSIGASRRVPPVSPTKMVKASRASTASIDDSSDTSFASARSPLANGPSALRGGLKGNRRESSVMGPPSHIPSLSGQARARQQSLGMGRASTATPSSGTAAAAAAGHYPSEPNRSTSAVLGDSTRQNRPASAMAVPVSPSKISTFARGPLPRSTGGMKDLVAVAEADMGSKAAGGAKGLRRMYSISSLSSIGSGGARNNAGGHLGI